MMTQYPYGIGGRRMAGRSLAGVDDPVVNQIADALNNALQGGPQGSPASQERVEFYSDVMSKTGEKFFASEKGRKILTDTANAAFFSISLPMALAAFGAGYLLAKYRKG